MAFNDVSYSRAIMESDMAMRYDKEPLKGKRQTVEIPFYYQTTRYNRDPNLGIVYRLDATDRELDSFLVRKAEKIARAEAHVRIQSSPPRPATPCSYTPSPQTSHSSRRDTSRKSGECTRRRDSTPSKCRLRRTLNCPAEEVMMVLAPGGRVIRKHVKHERNCPSHSTRASPCVSGGEGDRSRTTSSSRVRTRICPCICHRGKSIRATCTDSVRRLLLRDWAREGRGWNSLPFECEGEGRFVSDTDMEVHIHFPPEVTANDYGQRFPFQNVRSPVPSSLLPSVRSRSSDFTSCYRETSFDTTASARLLPDSSFPSQDPIPRHNECPIGKGPQVSPKITKQDLDDFINPPIPLMDGVRSLRTIFSRPCFPHESASSKDNAFLSHRETSLPPLKRSHDDVIPASSGRKCLSGAFLSFFSKEKTQIPTNKSSIVTPLGSKPTQTIMSQRIVPEKPSSPRESRKRIETRSMTSGGTPSERSRSFGTKSSQDTGSKERVPSPSTSTAPTRLSMALSYRTRDSLKHLSKDVHHMKKSMLYNEVPTQEDGGHSKAQCLDSRVLSVTNQEMGGQPLTHCLDSRVLGATGSSDSTYDPEYHPGTESPIGRYRHRRDLCYPTCYQREASCANTKSRELYPSKQGRSPNRTPTHTPPATSPPLSHTPSLTTSTYVKKKIMVSMQTRSTCFSEETCLISEDESRTSFNRPSCMSVAAQCSCRNLIRFPCTNANTNSPYVVRIENARPKSEICPNFDSSPCSSLSPRSILTCSEGERQVCSSSGTRAPRSLVSCPNQLPPYQSSFPQCQNALPPCQNSLPPCQKSLPQNLSPCPSSCPNAFASRKSSLSPCPNLVSPCPSVEIPCDGKLPPCTSLVQSRPARSSCSPCSSQRTCPCSFPSLPFARGSPRSSKPPTPSSSLLPPICTSFNAPCDSEPKNVTLPTCASVAVSPCPSLLPRCESVGVSPIPSLQQPCEDRTSSRKITWDNKSCEGLLKKPSSIRTVIKCPSSRSTKCENIEKCSSEECQELSPSKTSIHSSIIPCPATLNVCPPQESVVPSVASVRSMLSSAWSRCEEAVAERIRTICGPLTPCSSGASRRVCRPSQISVSPCPSRRKCPASPARFRGTDGVTSAYSAPIRPDPGSSGECRQATLRSSCPCDVLATSTECYSSRTEPQCPVTSMYEGDCSELPVEVQENLMLFQWFPSMRLVVFSLILLSHLIALVIKLWYSQPKSGAGFLFC